MPKTKVSSRQGWVLVFLQILSTVMPPIIDKLFQEEPDILADSHSILVKSDPGVGNITISTLGKEEETVRKAQ